MIMNKEETKKAAEVMLAWAEGKTIEVSTKGCNNWTCLVLDPLWDWDGGDYRIKPEARYRPFKNAEEVMEAIKEHGDWVKRVTGSYYKITYFSKSTVELSNNLPEPYCCAFENYKFLDDTPFGKLVEK